MAITRAQALLIIIGDPVILSLDPRWRRFLNSIYLKGGWRGKEIDWDPKEQVQGSSYDHARNAEAREMSERLRQLTQPSVIMDSEEDTATSE